MITVPTSSPTSSLLLAPSTDSFFASFCNHSSMIIQCRKILHCNDKLLFIVDHLLDVGSIKLGIFES